MFALINDVERVVTCLPGATLEGQEGEAYRGRVRFKVGPISATYAGTVRFTDVDEGARTLRLSARGADAHGNGDAEADVTLVVGEASGGARMDLRTDLSVRGKIAQFGKGAISSVSTRLLDQFARNLGELLQQPAGATAIAEPVQSAGTAGEPAVQPDAVDGLAMLVPPGIRRYAPLAGVAAVAFVQAGCSAGCAVRIA
ncbi:SRPBCC family protein [Saccharomonospora sp. CUA-673]|uniref:SRPBCC family protein n=1 Tax=Saccharomonospora sp. CUA-673 TaxID=1904969 RepID=UPI003519C9E2